MYEKMVDSFNTDNKHAHNNDHVSVESRSNNTVNINNNSEKLEGANPFSIDEITRKKNKKKTVYIVQSTKGGCGKTTLSIAFALSAAAMDAESDDCDKNPFNSNTLLIDFDFLGTNMKLLLGNGVTKEVGNPDFKYYRTLNDIVKKAYVYQESISGKFYSYNINKNDLSFDVIFSGDRFIDKDFIKEKNDNMFYNNNSIYEENFIHFMDGLYKCDYNNFIFDMPVGFQGRSYWVYNYFLKNNKAFKDELEVKFILIYAANISHIKSNIEWAYNFQYQLPKNLTLSNCEFINIINDVDDGWKQSLGRGLDFVELIKTNCKFILKNMYQDAKIKEITSKMNVIKYNKGVQEESRGIEEDINTERLLKAMRML